MWWYDGGMVCWYAGKQARFGSPFCSLTELHNRQEKFKWWRRGPTKDHMAEIEHSLAGSLWDSSIVETTAFSLGYRTIARVENLEGSSLLLISLIVRNFFRRGDTNETRTLIREWLRVEVHKDRPARVSDMLCDKQAPLPLVVRGRNTNSMVLRERLYQVYVATRGRSPAKPKPFTQVYLLLLV